MNQILMNHKQYKRFLLVFNNKEGRNRARKRLNDIIKRLGKYNCSFEILESSKLSERKDLNSFDSIVAVGGDGTVLSVVPYAIKHKLQLGVVPCGTANLFASGLSIPTNIDKAIETLFEGNEALVDLGKAGEKYFTLRIGIGYDAEIVNGAKTWMKDKLGYLAYFFQGIIKAFKLSLKKVKITIDGHTHIVNANSIIIANCANMFRNVVSISPNGSTADGKLDVFILMSKNFSEFLSVFWQVLRGKHINNSKVLYKQGKNIKIESCEIDSHIDGEPCFFNNIDIKVIPKALKVLVPIPAISKTPTPAIMLREALLEG